MIYEYDDLDAPEAEYQPLDLKVIKEKIPSFSSEKLCEIIVCDQYFGCFREIAIMCMEELAQRREKGDTFHFESYIDKSFKELPELNLTLPNITDVLQQTLSQRKKS